MPIDSENPAINEQPKWVRCFLEATGIAAGVAVVNMLAGEVVNKTVIIKAVKNATKIVGKRVLGAIGLALIVGEYI